MTTPDPHSHDTQLDALVAHYIEAIERGETPDREKLIAEYPALADGLRRFFTDYDRLQLTNLQPAANQVNPDATFIPQHEPQPGTIFGGRYKLLQNIGEGGMGSVWVAEQKEPVKRKVAIKLVKAGMDSKQVLARFEAERQALAMMDHPNIAKVFDGGITEHGRPYFVMEYVKGVPFTEYCDKARLSLKERLNLFIPVCQAVQHAHHKGIVHRDLKPSNILICLYDGKPVPKVIDFGLAKAMHQQLTEQSIFTAHGVMVGTPLYMSPEQAEHNNLDVDTRTDIYSLGVVLYELLTGTTPLEREQLRTAAYNEVLRLIKEVEPPRPSTRLSTSTTLPSIAAQRSIDPRHLQKSLAGDLDWIVMKSLEKERSRRYETANGFVRDIERFLNDEAVEACPPSRSYRLKRFVKKHKGQVFAVSVVLLTLVGGIVATSWQSVRARQAEQAATESEQDAVVSERKAVEALGEVTKERDAKEIQRRLADERASQLQRHSYRLGLQVASRAIQSGELEAATGTLLDIPEVVRGWEWQYLFAESDISLSSIPLPAGTSIKNKSPDGAFALLEHKGEATGPFSLMRAIDGEVICKITLPKVEEVLSVAMSSDARRIAFLAVNQSDSAIGLESTVYVWDRDRRSIIWTQSSNSKTTGDLYGYGDHLSISANGQRVAIWGITSDRPETLAEATDFSTSTGCCVFDIGDDHTRRMVHAPGGGQLNEDGSFLVAHFPSTQIVDLNDIATTEKPFDEAVLDASRIALTGDPKQIAFHTWKDDRWYSYDLEKRTVGEQLDDVDAVNKVVFHDAGRRGLGVIEGKLTYWMSDHFNGSVQLGHVHAAITDLCIDEASQSVFAYSPTRIYRYPLLTDGQLRRLYMAESDGFTYITNGQMLTIGYSDGTTVLRDRLTSEAINVGEIEDQWTIDKSGTVLASVDDGFVSISDSRTGTRLRRLKLQGEFGRRFSSHGVMFDRDEQRIVMWGHSYETDTDGAYVSDLESGDLLRSIELNNLEDAVIFFGKGHVWLKTHSGLKMLNITTGDSTTPSPTIIASGMSVSTVGDRLAVVENNIVQLYTFPALRPLSTFKVMHTANSQICWGLNDTRLVVSNDTSMSICDVGTSDVLLTLPINHTLSLGLFHKPIPFRDRWPTIQSVDQVEADPTVVSKAVVDLKTRVLETSTDVVKFNSAVGMWQEAIRSDDRLSAVEKLCELRLLHEGEARFEDLRKQTQGSLNAMLLAAEQLRGRKEEAHWADLMTAFAQRWRPSINELNQYAWDIALKADGTAEQYAIAVELAMEAKNRDPANPAIVNTLGVARYRNGDYESAIMELAESDRLLAAQPKPESYPGNQIFTAMAQLRLGNIPMARVSIEALQERQRSGKIELGTEDSGFLDEAVKLLESLSTSPESATEPAPPADSTPPQP